jgi:hypothetical protein
MAIHTMNGACLHGFCPHIQQSMMRHATRPLIHCTPCAVRNHTRTASITPFTSRIQRIRIHPQPPSLRPQVHAQCVRVQHMCAANTTTSCPLSLSTYATSTCANGWAEVYPGACYKLGTPVLLSGAVATCAGMGANVTYITSAAELYYIVRTCACPNC